MHKHGQRQLARRGPNCVQARVVHIDQSAQMVAHVQPQRLPNLQPLRAPSNLRAQAQRGLFAKAVAKHGPRFPCHAAEDAKALGGARLEVIKVRFKKSLTPAAVKIHINPHLGFIQEIQQRRQRLLVPASAKGRAQMVVCVNHREAGFEHLRCLCHQRRAGPEVG